MAVFGDFYQMLLKKRFYWSSEAGVEMECKEAKEASQVKRMSEANERKSEATVATGE